MFAEALHTVQQRECSVQQLHLHTLQSRCCWLNVEQVQHYWLIRSKHNTTSHHWCESIANLASCSGDQHVNGCLAHCVCVVVSVQGAWKF